MSNLQLPAGYEDADIASLRWQLFQGLKDVAPSKWSTIVVVIRPWEGVTVMSRVELGRWFRRNAMHALARRIEKAHVPPHRVLCWAEAETDSELMICEPPPALILDADDPVPRSRTALSLLQRST